MADNKFPQSYHSGALSSDNPYRNKAYNIYTETTAPAWQPGDNEIDFYTFKDVANNTDSPETSYTLIVIKNQGEAGSMLDLTNVSINNVAGVSPNPFSIVTNYSDINVSGSIQTGTEGLHTIPFADFPSSFVLDGVDYGSSAANYAPLSPEPIGFFRLVTTGEEIESSNTGDPEPFTDFGSSSVLRYVPFYNPADLILNGNAIGSTEEDYGNGDEIYPHYACILIKCDPTEPMQINPGEVVLNITHTQYSQINIDLVMTAYNIGNVEYQQGWLYKHGIDFGFNDADSSDTGDWRWESHEEYSAISPNIGTSGPYNESMVLPGEPDEGGGFPWAATGNSVPACSTGKIDGENFFLPPRPKNLFSGNKNYFLRNDATNNFHADRLPCVRIWDNTTFSGGIQWFNWDAQGLDITGQRVDYGIVNSASNYLDSTGNTIIKERVYKTEGNDDYGEGPFYIINDTIQGSSGSQIVFNNETTLGGGLQSLTAGEYLYLVYDWTDGKQNGVLWDETHRRYGGVPTIPNAIDANGRNAFRAAANVYPFYHKDYHVPGSNPLVCGPTQKESIGILQAAYDFCGMNQKHIYRYNHGWASDGDGNFNSNQDTNIFAQHGYALGGHSTDFETDTNDPNGGATANFKARTHYLVSSSEPDEKPGIHSYYKGNRLGSNNFQGLHFDAVNGAGKSPDDANYPTGSPRLRPDRSYSKSITDVSATSGFTSVKKHMHIRDILRIPDLVSLEGNPQAADYDNSTVAPSLAWSVFNPDDYTETSLENAYASFFPWVDSTNVWNSNNATWYDGQDTKTGSTNRILQKENLLANYEGYNTEGLKNGFTPLGFRVRTTGGVEKNSDRPGYDSEIDAALDQTSTDVFAEDSSNWEDIIIGGFNVKQKTVKLLTKAAALQYLDGS